MGRDALKTYTVHEAQIMFDDDLPRFMTSSPTKIQRKYGWVDVTQEDIDQTNWEIDFHQNNA